MVEGVPAPFVPTWRKRTHLPRVPAAVDAASLEALAAGLSTYFRRTEGRGWPYFSQPICGDDRSLFSPAPSPPVPRQWAQSANSLEKWYARQDSNLRPSA